ncbi:hypothetical protein, partial [Lentzea sp.]|uniref:hypothetical protein n=1 Tax=Lentzea sp. TaxID=56099 RepID=UPI002ECFFF7A
GLDELVDRHRTRLVGLWKDCPWPLYTTCWFGVVERPSLASRTDLDARLTDQLASELTSLPTPWDLPGTPVPVTPDNALRLGARSAC